MLPFMLPIMLLVMVINHASSHIVGHDAIHAASCYYSSYSHKTIQVASNAWFHAAINAALCCSSCCGSQRCAAAVFFSAAARLLLLSLLLFWLKLWSISTACSLLIPLQWSYELSWQFSFNFCCIY